MKPLARNLAIAAVAAFALAPQGARAQWYSSYPQGGAAPQQPYAIEVAPGTYVIRHPAEPHRAAARHVERKPAEKARARVHNDPALIEELRRRYAKRESKRHHMVERTDVRGPVTVVRGKPRVVVHKRVVDDPPTVIVRPHLIDEMPRKRGLFSPPPQQIERDLPPYVERGPVPLPPSWHPEPDRREPHAVRHKPTHKKVRHAERDKEAPPPVRHTAVRHVDSAKANARSVGGDQRTIKADAEVTILGPDRLLIRIQRKGSGGDARAD
jgi:hypothetical protein